MPENRFWNSSIKDATGSRSAAKMDSPGKTSWDPKTISAGDKEADF
jgi:hypothetical protein